ncbi:AhpC/TSA antioxidant enzyme-domain-containing protein [Mycena floridula]|nr:AhpC/TSA antioxidant enzyme-domain-containing protein [Mycena floridula]
MDPDALPTADSLKQASDLDVLDVNGGKVKFDTIFADKKSLIVFIRHFFCGVSQMYVEDLAAIDKSALDNAGTQIIVVGCGNWEPIKSYSETTGFPASQIYTDPTRTLFKALGMNVERLQGTPAGEKKRSYIKSSALSNAPLSIWQGPLKHLSLVGKQGNISQLGGDFVFGPGNTCSFAHRMRHTEDHVEVQDLLKAGGVQT